MIENALFEGGPGGGQDRPKSNSQSGRGPTDPWDSLHPEPGQAVGGTKYTGRDALRFRAALLFY